VWNLLRKRDWSAQIPVRRAIERDDEQVEVREAAEATRIIRSRSRLNLYVTFSR
jgi:hypothetical protein